jgi:CRP/FNR family transcriptional regulator, cyclic AMP receptor protein
VVSSFKLNRISLFKDISPAVLEEISAHCEELTFRKGQVIFREGEKADKLHFLINGSVNLRVNIMTRPESITVSFVSKSNECFGWSGLVSPHHYTTSAICEEDCQILTVSGDALLQILSQNTDAGFLVMYRIANLVSERLRNSRQALIKTL